ncbi:tRNA (adenosine(37)-N6)-dimethylallyltransferase MiaA [Kamptonema cortianum]|uniref:tRNA dimethylallyltransferase n=1 Tax=Geitlerinema calcuttense NRMC-F 0142 TaxID=2922238 RepID=A0ABT7LXM2_9CYAN|nr:tRNA (adenosine(37)-N6)-dimethylallyltransferase MiaA [Geitlerinema calcuttense]MDK3155426.1 tRNA (adenosine(37)-N6)-dimethylallyltransferase MiaA [Kamptonema cortianum]MDL5056767.1 tRNA (adenosine(37)-N6)-dimethylallyltransferase MiaA [Geitlerinema calcuttense NRMC-F 0142]
MSQQGLIVICGATATGKSGLALQLAQRLGSVILSADSRQVYREFNIGTAKPTEAECQSVRHELIDICDPTETLTVADYQEQAQRLIAKFHQDSILPLLVGGTGLYIKSVVRGMKIPRVAPQTELRSQLASLGQSQCYAMLQQVDPQATQKIHENDSVRTLRALEVFYVTGCPISQQQGENPPLYSTLQIGLDTEDLTARIARRTQQMIADGFVAEVEYLCQKYGVDLPLLNTLGYQEIKQYLAGKISLEEAIELTILHTRQFAKRQRTWFRANPQIEWFDADCPDLIEKVGQRIQEFQDTQLG